MGAESYAAEILWLTYVEADFRLLLCPGSSSNGWEVFINALMDVTTITEQVHTVINENKSAFKHAVIKTCSSIYTKGLKCCDLSVRRHVLSQKLLDTFPVNATYLELRQVP
jgi:hypothetical protein